MRFWLVTVGESVPLPGSADRPWRTGLLGRYLARRGHEVRWWTSSVDHFRKRFHQVTESVIHVEPRYEIRFLPGRLYRRNISLARVRNHREIAEAFRQAAERLETPDLILCALPPLELCTESVRLGRAREIPVFLDLRDPWPDVFYRLLPRPLRRLGPLIFRPLVWRARKALREATGLVAVSQGYLDWGLELAQRHLGPRDTVITHGYPTPPTVSDTEVATLRGTLDIRDGMLAFWFAGSFAWFYDISTIIEVARGLTSREDVLFVLTGTGDREAALRAQGSGLKNVRFTGWLDQKGLACLGKIASAGLVAYVPDAPMTLTNKLFEYMSAGLPLVLGLPGEAEALVRKWDCGVTYRPGDVEDMTRAVLTLADDPELRLRLGAGSRRAFRSEFAEDVIYPRFVTFLEGEAAKGRTNGGRGRGPFI